MTEICGKNQWTGLKNNSLKGKIIKGHFFVFYWLAKRVVYLLARKDNEKKDGSA